VVVPSRGSAVTVVALLLCLSALNVAPETNARNTLKMQQECPYGPAAVNVTRMIVQLCRGSVVCECNDAPGVLCW
jgi:hypothetical protein